MFRFLLPLVRTIMYSVSYLAATPVPPSGGPSVSNSAEGRPVPPPHRTAPHRRLWWRAVHVRTVLLLQHTTLHSAPCLRPPFNRLLSFTHSLRRPSFSLSFTRIANKQSKGASRQVSYLIVMIQYCPEVLPLHCSI